MKALTQILYYFGILHAQRNEVGTIIVIPNVAGYFAKLPTYGKARDYFDPFFTSLSDHYNVQCMILPGQHKDYPGGKFSYSESIKVVSEAIAEMSQRGAKITGIIGMSLGAAIAVKAIERTPYQNIPLIAFNTRGYESLNHPDNQDDFLSMYEHQILLNEPELMRNAPGDLNYVLKQHTGRIKRMEFKGGDLQPMELNNLPFIALSEKTAKATLDCIINFFGKD